MNLFDILSHDERIVVLSNVGESIIYSWNRSLTLQCFRATSSGNDWEEIGVRTLSDPPFNYEHARAAAMLWQGDGWKEEDEKNETSKPHCGRGKKASRKDQSHA